MRNSVFIKVQTVPLLQKIKYCNCVSEPHLEIRPHSLTKMFQSANLREQRKKSFNQHSVVPLAAPTNLQVLRLIGAAAKAVVCKDNHFSANGFDQRQKLRVGNICRFHIPISNESEFVGQNAQFAANNPSPRGKALFTDSLPVWLMNRRIG